MKIKLICFAIATVASLASTTQAIGQEVKLDGSSAGVVARKYTGANANPFFDQFVAKLRESEKSAGTTRGKAAAKYLAQLGLGGYYGYIHQTTRPLTEQELQTGIRPEGPMDLPVIASQATIDQLCQKKTDNTVLVTSITYVAEADSKGALTWQVQRSFTSLMTACPNTTM